MIKYKISAADMLCKGAKILAKVGMHSSNLCHSAHAWQHTILKAPWRLAFHNLTSPWPCWNAQLNTVPLLGMLLSHTCGGKNLNHTFQIWAISSHSCTAYQQLKFCVWLLLDGLCKWAKFQVRFQPDQLGHSLVRVMYLHYNIKFSFVQVAPSEVTAYNMHSLFSICTDYSTVLY
jgi:hypothetical protein